jgi:hypothetical protein
LLSSLLKDNGIDVKQSPGDADYDIFMSACRAALETDVVVVADDTDILVLFQHHFNPATPKNIPSNQHKALRYISSPEYTPNMIKSISSVYPCFIRMRHNI